MADPRRTRYRSLRLLDDAREFLGDHPGWNGLVVCGALILPIIAIVIERLTAALDGNGGLVLVGGMTMNRGSLGRACGRSRRRQRGLQ